MNVVLVYVIMSSATILITFTLFGNTLAVFGDLFEGWTALEARSEQRAATKIAGPSDLSMQAVPMIKLTLTNEGNVPVAPFADWDVIFETQLSSALDVSYLTYTTTTSPAKNQWTVLGIYLNAASSTPEIADPGLLDPGEQMVVLANPSPAHGGNSYGRATFVTPNGATTSVTVFKRRLLHVLDKADLTAYQYKDDGTLFATSSLDSLNADATGITTDDLNFWTTDAVDDLVYKYDSDLSTSTTWSQAPANADGVGLTSYATSTWIVDAVDDEVYEYNATGTLVSQFGLDTANTDPQGITTDGTNIWVVDEIDDVVFKYDMGGASVSSFLLTAANQDPTGMTTDGTLIWVADAVDDKVYAYSMSGIFSTEFSLATANADPQGLTVSPR